MGYPPTHTHTHILCPTVNIYRSNFQACWHSNIFTLPQPSGEQYHTSLHSTVMMKMAWERELCSFMFVALKSQIHINASIHMHMHTHAHTQTHVHTHTYTHKRTMSIQFILFIFFKKAGIRTFKRWCHIEKTAKKPQNNHTKKSSFYSFNYTSQCSCHLWSTLTDCTITKTEHPSWQCQ